MKFHHHITVQRNLEFVLKKNMPAHTRVCVVYY